MKPDEFLHKREPDSAAFERATLLILDAVKTLEHAWQLSRWNADAGVMNRQLRLVALNTQAKRNFTFKSELESIGNEIEDNLLPHIPVHIDRLWQWRTIDHQVQPRPFASRSKIACELGC